jgi:ribA/ribD-fused uncharacterized protein
MSNNFNTDENFYENDEIVCFKSGYLSQWYISPFILDSITYNCCEKRMMHQKAIIFLDNEIASAILDEESPKIIKKLGREVKNFDDNEWNKYAENIVYEANLAKFSQNIELKEKLLSTQNKLIVETSPYDSIWGNGLNITSTLNTPIENWNGTNKLGKILMKVRDFLKNNN